MWCIILFGEFATEVVGPFEDREAAWQWFRSNYGGEQGAVVKIRKAV